MSPARVKEKNAKAKPNQTSVQPQPTEPDVTVHSDVDGSAFWQPSHEEIAALAYSYWISRRPEDGSAEEDWLRAERELNARRTVASERGSSAGKRSEAA